MRKCIINILVFAPPRRVLCIVCDQKCLNKPDFTEEFSSVWQAYYAWHAFCSALQVDFSCMKVRQVYLTTETEEEANFL